MYPTHAASLTVAPREGETITLTGLLAAARNVAESWCDAELGCAGGTDDSRETAPDADVRLVVRRGATSLLELREVEPDRADRWAWQAVLERPQICLERGASTRRLRTDIQMRAEGPAEPDASPRLRVTIREQVAAPGSSRPTTQELEATPPCSLLGLLLDRFRVYQGDIEWTRSYWKVSRADQIDDLHRRIADPARTVPLVVCVGDNDQGPPVEVAGLAGALVGTARVVHLVQPRLTGRLRSLIGDTHRIGWNTIRVYRPGYGPSDHAGQHPFFRRAEIEKLDETAFHHRLSHRIRREESFLIEPDATVRDRIRSAERVASERAERQIASIMGHISESLGEVERTELEDSIALLTGELAKLRANLIEAEGLAQHFADELRAEEERRRNVEAHRDTLRAQVSGATQAELPDVVLSQVPATLAEAVRHAIASDPDGVLEVTDRVLRDLEGSKVDLDPVDVRDMLLAIRDVGLCYRAGHGDGRTVADHFRDRGIDYKADVSDTAKQQHRADYEVAVERDGVRGKVLMGPHVALSMRHRIYWHHDRERQRFVIGHIGDHLRDASTR